MKKNTRERPPARKLDRKELDTGVLAAGCGTQGCSVFLRPGSFIVDPAPFLNFNFSSISSLILFR